jgi:hypothetical protein
MPRHDTSPATAGPLSAPLADDDPLRDSFGAVTVALGVVAWLLLVTVAAASPLFW